MQKVMSFSHKYGPKVDVCLFGILMEENDKGLNPGPIFCMRWFTIRLSTTRLCAQHQNGVRYLHNLSVSNNTKVETHTGFHVLYWVSQPHQVKWFQSQDSTKQTVKLVFVGHDWQLWQFKSKFGVSASECLKLSDHWIRTKQLNFLLFLEPD